MEQQTFIAQSICLYHVKNTQKYFAKIIAEDERYVIREIPQEKAELICSDQLNIMEAEEMHPTETNIPVILNNNTRLDLLACALEGGSLWCYLDKEAIAIIDSASEYVKGVPLADRLFDTLEAGKTVPINDKENRSKTVGQLSMASITEGEQLMIEKHIEHFADALYEDGDATTADVWLQYACLKDISFG